MAGRRGNGEKGKGREEQEGREGWLLSANWLGPAVLVCNK